MKKWMRWLIAIAVAVTVYCLVYFLPLTYPFFFPGEELELHYIYKTTLLLPEGETAERYSDVEATHEEIQEILDIQTLLEALHDIRVTVYSEYAHSRWVGDVVYEIDGHIASGLRKGKFFHIELGIPEESYLRSGSGNWKHRIQDPKKWIDLIESLEQQ